ncbi:MAG TPA: DUF5318 family protein [Acidimicrobiales bacterium]|jgi:hypothetical protein|nr:DUF5318 family protein [Acidimicrobiales bacterium]
MPSGPSSFRPRTLARGGEGHEGAGGEIDYRLTRQALVSEFRKGRIAQHEVCDAHPELRRVAAEYGAPTSQTCPICEEQPLVLVTFVFGPRLPAHGRCLTMRGELAKITRGGGTYGCYVVEVCTGCWWNHLARSFVVDGQPTASTRAQS